MILSFKNHHALLLNPILLSDLFPQTLASPVSSELDPVAEVAPEPDTPALMANSEECYFCGERVYLLERISAEGKFFHRTCFTCARCKITLRLGGYTFDQDTGDLLNLYMSILGLV